MRNQLKNRAPDAKQCIDCVNNTTNSGNSNNGNNKTVNNNNNNTKNNNNNYNNTIASSETTQGLNSNQRRRAKRRALRNESAEKKPPQNHDLPTHEGDAHTKSKPVDQLQKEEKKKKTLTVVCKVCEEQKEFGRFMLNDICLDCQRSAQSANGT